MCTVQMEYIILIFFFDSIKNILNSCVSPKCDINFFFNWIRMSHKKRRVETAYTHTSNACKFILALTIFINTHIKSPLDKSNTYSCTVRASIYTNNDIKHKRMWWFEETTKRYTLSTNTTEHDYIIKYGKRTIDRENVHTSKMFFYTLSHFLFFFM